jgi:hypothetical protein
MKGLKSLVKRWERNLLWATPLKRLVVPRYQFSFSPIQLSFLNHLFVESHQCDGISLEIGCFVGATTVHLNANYRYGLPKRKYLALDTFSGFTKADIAHESMQRGKDLTAIDDDTLFSMNSESRFQYTMRINGLDHVDVVKMDANNIQQLQLHEPISLALIDLDLYLPTKASLAYVVPRMQKGGFMIVDDCIPNSRFDGSLQALKEDMATRGLSFEIQHEKLGVVRF